MKKYDHDRFAYSDSSDLNRGKFINQSPLTGGCGGVNVGVFARLVLSLIPDTVLVTVTWLFDTTHLVLGETDTM